MFPTEDCTVHHLFFSIFWGVAGQKKVKCTMRICRNKFGKGTIFGEIISQMDLTSIAHIFQTFYFFAFQEGLQEI